MTFTPEELRTAANVMDLKYGYMTLPNRVPRVWRHGDPEPEIGTKARDRDGGVAELRGDGRWHDDTEKNYGGWQWEFWHLFPVTEILPEVTA